MQELSDGSKPILYAINGNHDIGFHYTMTNKTKSRFDHSFQTDSVKLIQINGINLVTINSITMEGDYCDLCSHARHQLHTISEQLCPQNSSNCDSNKPIVLTHFTLYRESEKFCDNDLDSIPESQKYIPYIQKWDCLSMNATQLILNTIKPRLVITGHTHYGCVTRHPNSLYEWTVASFNYRNNLNPSLLLATISTNKYSINKCLLANEITFHIIDLIIIVLFINFNLLFKYRRKLFK